MNEHDHDDEKRDDGARAKLGPALRDPKASKAVLLADLIQERASMVLSPTGRAYARIGSTAHACDSEAFAAWCAAALWAEYRTTIARSTIGDVARALSHGLKAQPIPVRIGGDLSRITIDLGSSTLAVTSMGIAPASDAVFARSPGSQPLPSPILPADPAAGPLAIEELRAVLGVDTRVMVACVAWLLAALRPERPYPILYIRGEQGSGKSVCATMLRSVIDPRRPALCALPREPRDLAILAEQVHVVGIDNLSTISGEMSDALCRLATGDGFITRALYSDRDLAVFDLARPMIMTSIVDAATRPDLLDRALIIDLPAREERRTEDELYAAVDALRPRVLGALLYAGSAALRAGEVAIPGDVRMHAPAAFAAAAAPALGLDAAAIVGAYQDSRAAAHGVTAEDPVMEALLRYLVPGKSWTGTMGTLLAALNDQHRGMRPRGWPGSARALGAAVRRLAPTLRGVGVAYAPPEARAGRERALLHRLTRDVG